MSQDGSRMQARTQDRSRKDNLHRFPHRFPAHHFHQVCCLLARFSHSRRKKGQAKTARSRLRQQKKEALTAGWIKTPYHHLAQMIVSSSESGMMELPIPIPIENDILSSATENMSRIDCFLLYSTSCTGSPICFST